MGAMEQFPTQNNPQEQEEKQEGISEGSNVERQQSAYQDVLQDISRMEAWNASMLRQAAQEKNIDEAKTYEDSLKNIQSVKNGLENGDIGLALKMYTALAGTVLKRLSDVEELKTLSRQYPNVIQEQIKQAQEYHDFINKLLLTKTGEPNIKGIEAAIAEKEKREIGESEKQRQERADEEQQRAAEQQENLECQKKFTALGIENGDILISKSGTQRKVIEVVYDPRRNGGGYVEVEVVRDGRAAEVEYPSFKDIVSAAEKNMFRIEKQK